MLINLASTILILFSLWGVRKGEMLVFRKDCNCAPFNLYISIKSSILPFNLQHSPIRYAPDNSAFNGEFWSKLMVDIQS